MRHLADNNITKSLALLTLLGLLAVYLPAGEPVADDSVFGVYHPDRAQPRPGPPERYATRIILRGPDVDIVIDADPQAGNPGITMTSRKTGQAVVAYLAPADRVKGIPARAVVGVRDVGRGNLPAALFTAGGDGFIQLREGAGAHVLRPSEIVR